MKEDNLIWFVYPYGSMNDMVGRLLSRMSIFVDRPIDLASPGCIMDIDLGTALISDLDNFRSQDIPVLLERGVFDVGIVGWDWIVERNADIIEVANFALARNSFSPIRLVLAAPEELGYKSIADLPKGATIATEYPVIVRGYLRQNGRSDIKVQLTYGQTERMVRVGAADAVVDIVETGGSLAANGLAIVEVIAESVMILAANKEAWNDPDKRLAIQKLGKMLLDCYRLMLLDERRGIEV